MEPLIHIVGHFGTTYSYATVGAHVTRVLKKRGLVGQVHNLDAEWHPSHDDLRVDPRECTHCLLFTAPREHFGAYAERYGRKRSAIYGSPNTDRLDEDHARLMSKFGVVITPSTWCANVVVQSVDAETDVWLLRLGAEPALAENRVERMHRLRERLDKDPVFIHLGSDQAWPGRKGTEELIEAWLIGREHFGLRGQLVLHLPTSTVPKATMAVRDMAMGDRASIDSVEVREAKRRGSAIDQIVALYDEADVMVLPSRCEGYGLMLHNAIVAGVPMVTTCITGQTDFLFRYPGAWIATPTQWPQGMAYESGVAPTVSSVAMAPVLSFASQVQVRSMMLTSMPEQIESDLWHVALDEWGEAIADWLTQEEMA